MVARGVARLRAAPELDRDLSRYVFFLRQVLNIFKDGQARYGPREHSPNIIRRLEEPMGVKVLGQGFPAEMVDDEPEEPGYEVVPKR